MNTAPLPEIPVLARLDSRALVMHCRICLRYPFSPCLDYGDAEGFHLARFITAYRRQLMTAGDLTLVLALLPVITLDAVVVSLGGHLSAKPCDLDHRGAACVPYPEPDGVHLDRAGRRRPR
jgi:hypothetical protein